MRKVAVVVPVYNVEKFLLEFISCLLRQTVKDFEVYFIDDCSTDNSGVLLRDAVKRNSAFHYVKNESRRGAAWSRNKGIECSQSEYVICLDADDLVSDDLLEELIRSAELYNADMIMLERGDFISSDCIRRENSFLNDDIELYRNLDMSYKMRTFIAKEQPEDFLIRCTNGTCDRMIKRELINKYQIRFQDLPSSNDVFYTLFATFAAKCIVHTQTSDRLYYRRIHSEPDRISNDRNPMCAFEALHAVKKALCQYDMWEECCIHFWIFALDSIEKQLFICKDLDRQREVYYYLQKEGLRKLGISDDLLYNNLPVCYKNQFNCIFTKPFEKNCFNDSMTFHALCEINQEKINNIFIMAEEKNLRVGYWGIGRMTEGFMSISERIGRKVNYLIDNNKGKQGQRIFNMEVVSFDEVAQKVELIIISNKQYFHEIYKQIKETSKYIKVLCIQEYLCCKKKLGDCIR